MADLIDAFLARTRDHAALGEISALSFGDYRPRMVEHFGRNRDPQGMTPTDFAGFRSAMAAKYAQSRLSKTITVCRMMFRWADESELLDRPVKFGPDFKVDVKKLSRARKKETGAKLLTPEDIRAMLK